jgi:hypothetical protein
MWVKELENNLIKQGLPDDQTIKLLRFYKLILLNPFLNILIFMANYAILGLVASLLVARLTKRVSMGFLSED